MAEPLKVPDIGDFDQVDVIEVLVAAGDTIEAEQTLITLESDKATMEVPAPGPGTVESIDVSVGDQVSQGDTIGQWTPGEAAAAEDKDETSAEEDQPESTDKAAADRDQREPESATVPEAADDEPAAADQPTATADSKPAIDAGPRRTPPVPFDSSLVLPEKTAHASPGVRKLARELGVDLNQVTGSGRGGRIVEDDVKGHVKGRMETGSAGGSGIAVAPMPKVDFSKFGEIAEDQLSRIQKLSAANLQRNWSTIPHVTQHDEADVTELEAFRQSHKQQAEKAGAKLTPLAFLIKACVSALKEFPRFNSSLAPDGETLILKQYFHIGVAVDTPNGLIVPVIRDCDQKSLLELGKEIVEVAGQARDGKLSPAQLQGGCMSISSLGGIGGTAFTPIINAPEVCILGVSRNRQQPIWNALSGTFEPRLIMPLSLSYDHRVIDGAAAARFTSYLADLLGDLRRTML